MPRPIKTASMITYDPYNVPLYTPVRFPISPPQDDAETDVTCVRLARAWIPYVVMCLKLLMWRDAWEADAETQQWAINQVKQIQQDLTVERLCMELRFRNKPENPCIIQSSQDGGVTWTDGWDVSACAVPTITRIYRFNEVTNLYEVSVDFGITWIDASNDDPRFSQPQSPPILGPDSLCKMAQNGVENWKQWTFDLWNAVSTAGGIAAIVAAVIFLFSGIYAWIALLGNPAVWTLGGAILGVISQTWAAIFTDDFWDDSLCYIYAALQIAQFEDDQWVTIASWQYLVSQWQNDARPAAQIMAGLLMLGGSKWFSDMTANGDNDGVGCNCDSWVYSFGDTNEFNHAGISLVEAQYQAVEPFTLFGKPPEQYHSSENTLWNRVTWTFTADEVTRVDVRIRSIVNDPVTARGYNFFLVSDEFPAGENIFTGSWVDDQTRVLTTGIISRHNVSVLSWQVTTRSAGNVNDRALCEVVTFFGRGSTDLA